MSSFIPSEKNFPLETLPEDFQAQVRDYANQSTVAPLIKGVRVSEDLSVFFLIPGIGPVPIRAFESTFNEHTLARISYDPEKASERAKERFAQFATARAARPRPSPESVPTGFAPDVARRVVLAAVATPEEARGLIRVSAAHGITDLWLEVSTADPTAAKRILQAGIEAARGSKIAVGASVRLFRNDPKAEPERTIRGETGAQFRDRSLKQKAITAPNLSYRHSYEPYVGWTEPNTAAINRLALVAQLPGLAGVILRDITPPGWQGRTANSNTLLLNGSLGYTVSHRRAFLQTYGIDPIDIPEHNGRLEQITVDLGPFEEKLGLSRWITVNNQPTDRPDTDYPFSAWWQFRRKENDQMLADAFASLRRASPSLPLFLEDRTSAYTNGSRSWFGSWEEASRLPSIPSYFSPDQIVKNARASSKTVLLAWRYDAPAQMIAHPQAPRYFANALRNAAFPFAILSQWDGLAVDLTEFSAADASRLLSGLPPP